MPEAVDQYTTEICARTERFFMIQAWGLSKSAAKPFLCTNTSHCCPVASTGLRTHFCFCTCTKGKRLTSCNTHTHKIQTLLIL